MLEKNNSISMHRRTSIDRMQRILRLYTCNRSRYCNTLSAINESRFTQKPQNPGHHRANYNYVVATSFKFRQHIRYKYYSEMKQINISIRYEKLRTYVHLVKHVCSTVGCKHI